MKYRVKRHEVVQPLDQSYRLIPLTKGQNAIVDKEDYDFLNQWSWFASFDKKTCYAARRRIVDGRAEKIYMHRVILGLTDLMADHKNHNTLDNRRCNLRPATAYLNALNNLRNFRKKRVYKDVTDDYSTRMTTPEAEAKRKFELSARMAKLGRSRSPKKRKTVLKNLQLARAARWGKKLIPTS